MLYFFFFPPNLHRGSANIFCEKPFSLGATGRPKSRVVIGQHHPTSKKVDDRSQLLVPTTTPASYPEFEWGSALVIYHLPAQPFLLSGYTKSSSRMDLAKVLFGPHLHDQYTLRSGYLLLLTSPPSQNWFVLNKKHSVGFRIFLYTPLEFKPESRLEKREGRMLSLETFFQLC